MAETGISPPFLEKISLPETVKVDTTVELEISGNWPTPNWNHTRTDAIASGNHLQINYLGTKRPGMAMQVLKPFTDTIEISFDTPGEWEVEVKGRSGNLSQIVTVKD